MLTMALRRLKAGGAKSSGKFPGHSGPEPESISPGVAVEGCGETVTEAKAHIRSLLR
jgi:hypothetical protein